MKLYHGTNCSSALNICYNGIDLSKSQLYLDFGVGFYTTPSYEHAAITAIRKTDKYNHLKKVNEKPYIVEITCNFNIDKDNIKIKQFPRHSDEWSEFVINNRLYDEILEKYHLENSNRDKKYDIIYGEIADGAVLNITYKINNGLLLPSDVKTVDLLKNGKPYGYQYSFHTERAKACITSMKCDIIHNIEEYKRIIDKSRKRR